MIGDPRQFLTGLFQAAVAAAQPAQCLPAHLPEKPKGRTLVVGAGKASAAMALALEQAWGAPLQGLVVVPYGSRLPTDYIEVVEAAHPVPDAAGMAAADRMLQLVSGLTTDDLVIALISGGGSALLSLPAQGLSLADKQAVNQALLRGAVPIADMNMVRKHLSKIKGGRLAAAAYPARVMSYIISDVPGDDPALVASGPTVTDASTLEQARAVVSRYGLALPPAAMQALQDQALEPPKPGDARLARHQAFVIASPQHSLQAAASMAAAQGVTPLIMGSALEGEARELGVVMAGMAQQVRHYGQPATAPCVLLSGGETTVTLRGQGVGGRNVEFLLALALKLAGMEGVSALAADTDGVDGASPVAGAIITPDTVQRARHLGLNPWDYLARNDAHSFFAKLGDQLITGPTHTNVNDFRAILIL